VFKANEVAYLPGKFLGCVLDFPNGVSIMKPSPKRQRH